MRGSCISGTEGFQYIRTLFGRDCCMKNYTSIIVIFFLACLLASVNGMSQGLDSVQQAAPMVIEEGGTGPYKAIAMGDDTLPLFTIYRPENLKDFGGKRKLPIVLWANGGCADTSVVFKNFLNEIASHGFIVFAVGPYPSSLHVDLSVALRLNPSNPTDLRNALDWAFAENSRETGKYFGKLDIEKVAVMGQSCGGLQALDLSPDPRITTTVICNSGALISPPPPGITVPEVSKDILQQLHGPILYVIGGTSDGAYPNAMDDFSRIEKVPAVMLNMDVGHGGTYQERHGGAFSIPVIAWLKWQLNGDPAAALMFKGKDCGLCKDPKWKIETENFK